MVILRPPPLPLHPSGVPIRGILSTPWSLWRGLVAWMTQLLASSSLWPESPGSLVPPAVMQAALAGCHLVPSFIKLPDWHVSLYFTTSSNASSMLPRSLTNLDLLPGLLVFKAIQDPVQQVPILGRAVMFQIGLPINAF